MKQFLTALTILILLLAGGIFFVALPSAKKTIEFALHDIGFKQARVESAAFSMTGLNVNKIFLDKEEFSSIKNMTLNIFWPHFLMRPRIDKIEIENFNLSADIMELRRTIASLNNIQAADNYNVPHIAIKNLTISTLISDQSYFLNGAFLMTQDDGIKTIKTTLNANQPQLSFQTTWAGQINTAEQKILIDGVFDEIKIQSKPLSINRGTGWASYAFENNSPSFNAQFDAGSGSIFSIAANAISVIIGQDGDRYPVMIRANAAGIKDVRLTSDLVYHHDVSKRDFTASLTVPSLPDFMRNLKAQNQITGNTDTTINALNINIDYQEDKRFAGGPLPFDIKMVDQGTDKLSGTFLIYPDSFDVRGTTETQADMLSLLQKIFTIPEENITDNVIRLDSNIKSLLR